MNSLTGEASLIASAWREIFQLRQRFTLIMRTGCVQTFVIGRKASSLTAEYTGAHIQPSFPPLALETPFVRPEAIYNRQVGAYHEL